MLSLKLEWLSLLCVGALALGGCVDTAADLGAPKSAALAQPAPLTARPGVSPHGASVALASLEGAPDAVASRFRQIFARAAESRDIATTAGPDADYRVRGYLSAYLGAGTTRLAYVWDIFDRDGRRARRLTDEVAVKSGDAPWESLDDTALTDVAARGADDLAAFLSNTPEAIAAASGAGAGLTVAAAARAAPAAAQGARPLGFAAAQ